MSVFIHITARKEINTSTDRFQVQGSRFTRRWRRRRRPGFKCYNRRSLRLIWKRILAIGFAVMIPMALTNKYVNIL